jgi:hypothetical protein
MNVNNPSVQLEEIAMSSQEILAKINHQTVQPDLRFVLEQMHIGVPRQMIERKLIEVGMDQDSAHALMAGADNCFIEDQITKGVPTRMIERKLIEAGMDQESAHTLVTGLELQIQELGAAAQKDAAGRNIVIGLIWLAFGGGITMWTYSLASEGGRYYFVWGPMVYGGFKVITGLYHAMISGVELQSQKFAAPAPAPAPAQKNAGGMYIVIGFVLLAVVWVISALCQAIR